jgi:hypothetical protein
MTESQYLQPLYIGWNLITLPFETPWTAASLGAHISNCSLVCRFDAGTQMFHSHFVGLPWDDFPLEKGGGYFVYVTRNVTFSLTGWPLTTFSVPLSPGWNLIGWPHEYNTTAESLGSALTNCTVVVAFNATTQKYVSHVVDFFGEGFSIHRGMGLFIYTTESSIWQGEG